MSNGRHSHQRAYLLIVANFGQTFTVQHDALVVGAVCARVQCLQGCVEWLVLMLSGRDSSLLLVWSPRSCLMFAEHPEHCHTRLIIIGLTRMLYLLVLNVNSYRTLPS
jgi:hypothetical protein